MEAEKKVLRQNAEALIKRKEYLFAELSRICDITKKGIGEVDADVYLRTIDRLEKSFEKITEEVLTLNCQLDRESQIPTKDFSTIQTLIEGIVKHCLKAKTKGVASRSQPVINTEEEAALPRLSLPIWEGDVATWSDFKAQFDSAVGRRSNLSGVAKLQYLHASLRGEPLSIVTQYTLSNESYDLAFRDLVLRYENKRRLASHHLSKILNFKSQCAPSGREHIKYMEVHRAALSALKQLKLEDLADFVLFELCYKNLSGRDQKGFDLDHDHNQVPSTREIFTYVEKIARSEELHMDNEPSLPNKTNFKQKKNSSTIKGSLVASIKQKPSCFNCNGDHMLYRCPSLLTLPVNERKMKVLELGCCVACLYKHPKKACKSKFSCKTCGSKAHNTVLHSEDSPVEVRNDQSDSASTSHNSCSCVSLQSKKTCVLGTLLCQVQDVWGNRIPVRALLDPGSEISIITSHLVKRLSLSKSPSTCQVEGIGPTLSQTLGNVRLTISSIHSSQTSYTLEAAVLPKICSLPKTNISNAVVDRFRSLELADPNFWEPGRIDLLLGVEVYSDILSTQEPVIIAGNPSAVRTTFGYVISGRVEVPEQTAASAVSLCLTKSSLETAITRFWETEETSQDVPADPADVLCEQHFLRTHEREPSGRFVVRLPFIPDLPPLGDNEEIALKRLRNLERRLAKNPSLAKSYEDCINEYIHLNHISIAPEEKASYLLPHHAVFKESSTTTKCRVVFDCSSLDDNGLSLNDRLYRGPPLLHDISLLLIKFRMFKVCFVADIKMMYRMVSVHPEDRRHLIIAWRSRRYQMNRLPFGLKPAGYLAGRCLVELANLHQNEFPEAAKAIRNNRYADDFCIGAETLEEANKLRHQLISLLAKGCFEIRRWSSNVSEALSEVPENFRDTPVKLPSGENGVKVLGVMWDQTCDAFVVRVVKFDEEVISKRSVLSYIARIYDIMGLFSPTIFLAKHFMQRLWLRRIQWDEPLPSDLAEEWKNYAEDLSSLSNIKIPRFLPIRQASIRLVGFSDASEKGMAAVIFIRWSYGDAEGQSRLLKSKTKLAPLKTLTIPRLELCAALLLAKLAKPILEMPDISFESVNFFTDSTIVLAWLERPLHELKIFVSNRVAEIKQTVPRAIWGYVPGQENPADLGSRGVSATGLKDAKLWWYGPDFLNTNYQDWPNRPPSSCTVSQLPELKENLVLNLQVSRPADEIIHRFSTLNRMQRVLGYVLRFSSKRKDTQPPSNSLGCLSTEELQNALYAAIRVTQKEYLEMETIKLQKGQPLNRELQKLSPFFDNRTRLIRVGGRLNRASFLSEDAKHPFLIPKRSHLAVLICDHYHRLYLHSGPRTTCAAIQRKFWIPSLMSLVKLRIHRCTRCLRFNAKPQQPLMADVIPERLDQSHCWVNCALDFGGPFATRESKARKGVVHKSYMCVFICLTTRAIHLEMVTDLTTAAFLAAFQRFTSRRSVPHTIYSDRGTNFVGARGTLQECAKFLKANEGEIFSAAAAIGTRWLLNVPYGPNFNGCAENGIKSAKALIRRQVGDQVLTFEEFLTLLCRVEQILNSRPISFTSLDVNDRDVVYLTPGHFIVGREMTTPPERSLDDNATHHDRWKRVSQMTQAFWKTWSTAYLHELMQRGKWIKPTRNLRVGDVVYVTGIGTSPLSWPLGRVLEVFVNPTDETVRVVRVRARGRDLVRPANKIIIIPTEK